MPSVLELLDTITGAHNNWVDGIKNDDPTFIGQIKADLHLVSVGMASEPDRKRKLSDFSPL